MRRIVLLLIVASVVMFALVLKTPLRTLRSAVFPEDGSPSEPQPPQKREPAAKRSKATRNTFATAKHDRRETGDSNGASLSRITAGNEAKAPVAHNPTSKPNSVSPHTLTISIDSVALYSINSTLGSIRTVLPKGTVVVPSLQVMGGEVDWTLVRVPELNVSGFIQTEDLAAHLGR